MKFSDRTAAERTAIGGWIRVAMMAREDACLPVSDNFKREREKSISEAPIDIAKMVTLYSVYQLGRHTISYTDYFQVTNPEEYAAILVDERKNP